MEDLLATIHAASAPGASPECRAAAAAACRSILATLGDATPPTSPTPSVTAPDIAGMVAALRGVPPDQLLELAINRLRAALPAGSDVSVAKPLKFHIIQVPARTGGQ